MGCAVEEDTTFVIKTKGYTRLIRTGVVEVWLLLERGLGWDEKGIKRVLCTFSAGKRANVLTSSAHVSSKVR